MVRIRVAETDVTWVIGWRVVVVAPEYEPLDYVGVGSGGPEWH